MNRNTTGSLICGLLLVLMLSVPAFAECGRQKAEIIIPDEARSSYENWGYAPAVKVGNTIYVSGVVSLLEGEGSYEERKFRTSTNSRSRKSSPS